MGIPGGVPSPGMVDDIFILPSDSNTGAGILDRTLRFDDLFSFVFVGVPEGRCFRDHVVFGRLVPLFPGHCRIDKRISGRNITVIIPERISRKFGERHDVAVFQVGQIFFCQVI